MPHLHLRCWDDERRLSEHPSCLQPRRDRDRAGSRRGASRAHAWPAVSRSSEIVLRWITKNPTCQEVEKLERLHTDIQSNDGELNSRADLVLAVVGTLQSFQCGVHGAHLDASARLESRRKTRQNAAARSRQPGNPKGQARRGRSATQGVAFRHKRCHPHGGKSGLSVRRASLRAARFLGPGPADCRSRQQIDVDAVSGGTRFALW